MKLAAFSYRRRITEEHGWQPVIGIYDHRRPLVFFSHLQMFASDRQLLSTLRCSVVVLKVMP